jgi:D-tagatose-1,6-bisphosphate aldolase subunit GatZ/KbaZ
MSHLLDDIVLSQKREEARGIASICSAHPWVLKRAMSRAGTGTAAQWDGLLLIESTCNQVNQFGGYTGMTPSAFVDFVHGLAAENGFPSERLILGGDHLGPNVWKNEPAESAMRKSAELVRAYVQAGYTKIHLDTSMRLGGDDPACPLDVELAARRAAGLAKAAEAVADPATAPRYVIGTEVPIPGGATAHEDGVRVTSVEDARRTLEATHTAFLREGLDSAWERLVALVVQPGVEFGDDFILDYKPEAARELAHFSETTSLVYEVHSTDYQPRDLLRALVRDHFAILKVGPALTFAFREAIFALTMMEGELLPPGQRSGLLAVLDQAMLRQPEYWQEYYHGTPARQAFARKYSLSDRLRYYWPDPAVQAAITKLFTNLEAVTIPLSLLSQCAPLAFKQIRMGRLPHRPASVIDASIQDVLDDYRFACKPEYSTLHWR